MEEASSSKIPSGNIPSNWAQKWSDEEDKRLLLGIEQYGENNWKSVAQIVGTRDPVKCMQRWEKGLKPGIIKGRWSEEEDRALVFLVSQGHKNWGQVAQRMPGRTSKQCRERWNNYLDPTLIHTPFTAEEDSLLLSLHEQNGNKWASIARHIPGRTENAVKLRYHAILKQQRLQEVLNQSSDERSTSELAPAVSSTSRGVAVSGSNLFTNDSDKVESAAINPTPLDLLQQAYNLSHYSTSTSNHTNQDTGDSSRLEEDENLEVLSQQNKRPRLESAPASSNPQHQLLAQYASSIAPATSSVSVSMSMSAQSGSSGWDQLSQAAALMSAVQQFGDLRSAHYFQNSQNHHLLHNNNNNNTTTPASTSEGLYQNNFTRTEDSSEEEEEEGKRS